MKRIKIIVYVGFLISILSVFVAILRETIVFRRGLFSSVEGVFTFFLFCVPMIMLSVVLFIWFCCKFNYTTKIIISFFPIFIINCSAIVLRYGSPFIQVVIFYSATIVADIFLVLFFFFRYICKNYKISDKIEKALIAVFICMILSLTSVIML